MTHRNQVSDEARSAFLKAQQLEITEHRTYAALSRMVKEPLNSAVLGRIADDELRHYEFWRGYTGRDVAPSRFQVWKYVLLSRIAGITFGIKLMEKGEKIAGISYRRMLDKVPDVARIAGEEEEHEGKLIGLIDEERLRYVGSIVLGLNDALVELTGALAGFTLALGSARIIAAAGLITGIAAALSMAASEYLSTKSEEGGKSPLRAALYTGSAYLATVFFLIFPFFLFGNLFLALGVTLANALVVIVLFTSYTAVARDLPFGSRFAEMAVISLGVAALSFATGYMVRALLGVEI